jgi:glycerophosphoryl diester phosphodiesterase
MWLRRSLLVVGGLLLALLVIYLTLAWQTRPVPAHPFFAQIDSRPLVIAHQGGDGLRPSNTMAAFDYAAELGVDVLEMDIHSTKDGVLVTIHDETVDRTTNGHGRVQDLTLVELQALDAGYHWPTLEGRENETARPFREQGITIPTLEAVFQKHGQRPMVIEIKQVDPPIVDPFCDLIRQYKMEDKVLVASFHGESMRAFRTACPEVATSAVGDEVRLFYTLSLLGLNGINQSVAEAFQVPEYSGDTQVLTPRFVADAHAHKVEIHAWTINEEEDIARMINLGVDGLITDYPDRVQAQLVGEN